MWALSFLEGFLRPVFGVTISRNRTRERTSEFSTFVSFVLSVDGTVLDVSSLGPPVCSPTSVCKGPADAGVWTPGWTWVPLNAAPNLMCGLNSYLCPEPHRSGSEHRLVVARGGRHIRGHPGLARPCGPSLRAHVPMAPCTPSSSHVWGLSWGRPWGFVTKQAGSWWPRVLETLVIGTAALLSRTEQWVAPRTGLPVMGVGACHDMSPPLHEPLSKHHGLLQEQGSSYHHGREWAGVGADLSCVPADQWVPCFQIAGRGSESESWGCCRGGGGDRNTRKVSSQGAFVYLLRTVIPGRGWLQFPGAIVADEQNLGLKQPSSSPSATGTYTHLP